ncbi:transmembrane ascorbate-dependent reductase CYB561-like [Macrosteles quadrilineatus]|uniref:transmembrane ascorbate-dependent reductase CYB561-like n=1 Tax=Macrosteles quadrilineatus TaxID=74068 RepID=UPI0023E1B362|nr:transmembrane ascorbate-dependent reductase CYB561-like [Macrosteles quadrilineatus]
MSELTAVITSLKTNRAPGIDEIRFKQLKNQDSYTMSPRVPHHRGMLIATLSVGLVALLLMIVWVFFYQGGVAWSSQPKQQFNYHVLAMTVAMVYFVAFELMTFRVLRNGRKKYLKVIHAGFLVPNIFLLVVGYWSILDVHAGRPNFYSFHSWMGIITTVLYLAQGFIGFVSFLWQKTKPTHRGAYLPYHVFFGLTTFVLGVTTTLLGLFEEIKKIPKFSEEAIMMNICGICIAVFTAMVIFFQTRPEYKRRPILHG